MSCWVSPQRRGAVQTTRNCCHPEERSDDTCTGMQVPVRISALDDGGGSAFGGCLLLGVEIPRLRLGATV